MIGGTDEHVAFLLLRALELQGEVLKAYLYAVIYKTLDPEVTESSCAMTVLIWIESVVGFPPSFDVCFRFSFREFSGFPLTTKPPFRISSSI